MCESSGMNFIGSQSVDYEPSKRWPNIQYSIEFGDRICRRIKWLNYFLTFAGVPSSMKIKYRGLARFQIEWRKNQRFVRAGGRTTLDYVGPCNTTDVTYPAHKKVAFGFVARIFVLSLYNSSFMWYKWAPGVSSGVVLFWLV